MLHSFRDIKAHSDTAKLLTSTRCHGQTSAVFCPASKNGQGFQAAVLAERHATEYLGSGSLVRRSRNASYTRPSRWLGLSVHVLLGPPDSLLALCVLGKVSALPDPPGGPGYMLGPSLRRSTVTVRTTVLAWLLLAVVAKVNHILVLKQDDNELCALARPRLPQSATPPVASVTSVSIDQGLYEASWRLMGESPSTALLCPNNCH